MADTSRVGWCWMGFCFNQRPTTRPHLVWIPITKQQHVAQGLANDLPLCPTEEGRGRVLALLHPAKTGIYMYLPWFTQPIYGNSWVDLSLSRWKCQSAAGFRGEVCVQYFLTAFCLRSESVWEFAISGGVPDLADNVRCLAEKQW